jgi:rubrerythrin
MTIIQKGEPMSDFVKDTNVPTNGCISRQAAIDEIRKCRFVVDGIEKIRGLPSAQPEPKRGKWIYHPEIGYGETWLCDQCGEKTTSTVMGKPRWKFCPMCGSRNEVTE